MPDNSERYTITEWIEQWGKPYYQIKNRSYVLQCCAAVTSRSKNRSSFTRRLPAGWRAEKPGGERNSLWFIIRDTNAPLSIKSRFTIAVEREQQALALQKQGYNQLKIAKKLGITPAGVSHLFKRLQLKPATHSFISQDAK